MVFRKTTINDINAILDIINQAKVHFHEQGIDQWQDGYPNQDSITNDIANNVAYVLEENQEIVATCMITNQEDPTYAYIEDGSWICSAPYTVIHRVAVKNSAKGKGFASILVENARKLYPNSKSIRVDTHRDNLTMQNLLIKNGFTYCGIIYLATKDKRNAYEKSI